MISIIKNLDKFGLIEEQQAFTIQSDMLNSAVEGKASVLISVNQILTAGQWFNISYGIYSLTFTVVETLSNNGLELPEVDEGTSIEVYVEIIRTYLLKNFNIFNDFNITCTASTFTIEARQGGSRFTVAFEKAESIDPANFYVITNVAGADRVSRSNFSIAVQTNIKNSFSADLSYDYQVLQHLKPYSAGAVYFSPARFIWGKLESRFYQRYVSPNPVRLNDWIVKSYFLSISEYYGDVPQYHGVKISEAYFLINGRIPQSRKALFEDVSFNDWMVTGKKFLSFGPAVKTVIPEQFEKLFFVFTQRLSIPESYRIVLRLKLFFTDDTFSSFIDFEPGVNGLKTGDVLEVDCGYNQLDIAGLMALNPTKTLFEYSVFLVGITEDDTETVLSEVKTYRVDYGYREFGRQFVFKNALGGFDTVYCRGKSDFENEIVKDIFEFKKPLNEDRVMSKLDRNVTETVFGNHNTGFVTKDLIQWIEELFASDQVFELQGGVFKPCRIHSSSVKTDDEDEMMINMEFKVEYLSMWNNDTDVSVEFSEFNNEFNVEFL